MMTRKVLIRVSCSEYSDWSDATKRKGSEMFRQQKLSFFSTSWICFCFFLNRYRLTDRLMCFRLRKIQICGWRISVKHGKQTASLIKPEKR